MRIGSGPVVALQNIAVQTSAKIPFAYKRASVPFQGEPLCPACEQRSQALELLFGSGPFSIERALDRFRQRAQHHSYTNETSSRRRTRYIIDILSTPPELRLRCVVTNLAVRQFDAGL